MHDDHKNGNVSEPEVSIEVDGQVRLVMNGHGIEDYLNLGLGIEFIGLTDNQEKQTRGIARFWGPLFYDY